MGKAGAIKRDLERPLLRGVEKIKNRKGTVRHCIDD